MDAAAKALSRFEGRNRYKDFKAFHFEQAIAFKRHLAEQTGQRSWEKLSKATLGTFAQVGDFGATTRPQMVFCFPIGFLSEKTGCWLSFW